MFISTEAEDGFTLIELLVTTVIIGVAIVPMVTAYTHSIRATNIAQYKSIATMLSRKQIETVLGTEDYTNISEGEQSGSFSAPYEEYSYVMDIQKVSGTDPDLEVKRIQIKIEFPSLMAPGDRTLSCADASACNAWDFTTFVAKRGL